MVIVALAFIVLLVTSFIVFRSRFRAHQAHAPVGGRRLRGVRPAFAVIGFALDNWIQSVAAVLMTATAVLMVNALRRTDPAI